MEFSLRSSREGSAGKMSAGSLRISGMEWWRGKLSISADGTNDESDGQTSYMLSLVLDEEALQKIMMAAAQTSREGKVRLARRKPTAARRGGGPGKGGIS